MSTSEPDPGPVNRGIVNAINAADAEGGEPLDLDAVMEAAGGEAAAQWRAAKASSAAWDEYREAEQAYWGTVTLRQLQLETVATLRMVEITLLKTDLTMEHRKHGWSRRITEILASMCTEFRVQVETETFRNPRAGYALARATMEEISPKWFDLDELSVAVHLAERTLDVLSWRLNLDPDER